MKTNRLEVLMLLFLMLVGAVQGCADSEGLGADGFAQSGPEQVAQAGDEQRDELLGDLSAEEFPAPINTNTVNNGTGAPPWTAEEAVARMESVPPGFKAGVFASEPDVQNPLQMTWDTRGRLWIAENYTYESDMFDGQFSDRIVILDGADGHGKFTSRKVFIDNLKNMMGFALGYGGVWAMANPNIVFIPDPDGDGVPDGPAEIVYDGFNASGSNMHTSANGLRFGIDGWIYGRTGHAHLQMVGPPGTPMSQRARLHGSLFRFHPRTRVFEAVSSGAVNTYGMDWDQYGEQFFCSTTVPPFWYEMPGAKFRSSSVEPNQKAYEVIDHIGDFDFGSVGESRRRSSNWAEGPWHNGHSVGGLMIYQGDNWPAEYRHRMYAINLFGHRVVAQTYQRSGSGYVVSRAPEPDLFEIPDPWFRGIDMTCGPDGGVFIADWCDTGDYHNRTGSNRLSGRIYKITYGDPQPSTGSDLSRMTAEELVALNRHANEWFPRLARQEFSNRMVDGRGVGNAAELLREQFHSETDVAHKLRSLLTLFVVRGTDESFLLPLLRSPEEHLRVWAIRLLAQDWPLDALHTDDVIPPGTDGWQDRGGIGVSYLQQRPAVVVGGPQVDPSHAVVAEFNRMAAEDPSSLVRLTLASTLQRMPFPVRPGVAAGLVARTEDATDKNIPLMVWYALIPLAEENPSALSALGVRSELRATRKYITRRLAEEFGANTDPINELIAAASVRDEAYQADIVDGLTQGLQGQRGLALPPAWESFSDKVSGSTNSELVAKVRVLDVLLGSPRGIAAATRTVLDTTESTQARRAALQSLLDVRAPDLRQIAEQMLAVESVNVVAAAALATFDDPTIGPLLVEAYPQFAPGDRPQLIAALASRPSLASALLDAVESGKLKRAEISAADARQIRSLNDAALTGRLSEIWGEIRDTPEAKLELLAAYKAELMTLPEGARGVRRGPGGRGGGFGGRGRGGNAQAAGGMPAALRLADRSAGRQIYVATCANCHKLFGEGGTLGPELTGGQKRRDLDMLLSKIVDPSSELPVESRVTIVALKDGRIVNGIVANRTSSTITLLTVKEPVTLSLSEIEATRISPNSLMPEGLLNVMDATQRRNLMAYLMGDEQAPLPPDSQNP